MGWWVAMLYLLPAPPVCFKAMNIFSSYLIFIHNWYVDHAPRGQYVIRMDTLSDVQQIIILPRQ